MIARRRPLQIPDPAAGERTLEVGPGTGYYTRAVAARLDRPWPSTRRCAPGPRRRMPAPTSTACSAASSSRAPSIGIRPPARRSHRCPRGPRRGSAGSFASGRATACPWFRDRMPSPDASHAIAARRSPRVTTGAAGSVASEQPAEGGRSPRFAAAAPRRALGGRTAFAADVQQHDARLVPARDRRRQLERPAHAGRAVGGEQYVLRECAAGRRAPRDISVCAASSPWRTTSSAAIPASRAARRASSSAASAR